MSRKFKNLIKFFLRKIGGFSPIYSKKIIQKFSIKKSHVFFGYYDTTPFNHDDSILLASSVSSKKAPFASYLNLGYFDLKNKKPSFVNFAKTKAWCWQMGARLRWLAKQVAVVSYNSIENEKYINIFQNPFSGQVCEKYELPFYDIDRKDSLAVSLNFSRLERLRPGYGYSYLEDATQNKHNPNDDGLIIYDIKRKAKVDIISLEQISDIKTDVSMDGAQHYFNHVSFSPYSDYFIFFHLWIKNHKRYRRLFLYNINKKKIELLSNNLISHYAWKNENEILITEVVEGLFGYNLYNIHDKNFKPIGNEKLVEDGHPSFINDDIIIADTYPNLLGYQKLFQYNLKEDSILKIGTFFSPPNFTFDNKCDLHPRLNRQKNLICIDSASSGKREIILLER